MRFGIVVFIYMYIKDIFQRVSRYQMRYRSVKMNFKSLCCRNKNINLNVFQFDIEDRKRLQISLLHVCLKRC